MLKSFRPVLTFFLVVLYLTGLWVGSWTFRPPGLSEHISAEHGIKLVLPRSLEGWHLLFSPDPNQVFKATTRAALATLTVEKTGAPATLSLETYSDQVEAALRPHLPGYDLQIRAPERFGRLSGFTTIKEYTGRFYGVPLRRQRLDFYFTHRGSIYHIQYDVPEKLLTYFRPDYRLIITGLRVEK